MDRRRLFVAVFAVLAVSLTTSGNRTATTSSAAQNGRIEGSVVTAQPYPEGTPLAGWRVLLGTNECKLLATAVTDDDGIYRFANLAPGNYAVELAFDQPYGQGWSLPSQWSATCGRGPVLSVEADKTVTVDPFRITLFSDPRGFFGSVFNDLNENGSRDASEPALRTSMREFDLDVIIEFPTDMEGNFRNIESATPIPGNPVVPPLNLTTCPAYPTLRDSRTGWRVTTPVPSSCGINGCAAKVGDQVFRCPDYGLYQVDPNPAYFGGTAWVNATPVAPGTKVTAWIGSTVCGEGYVWGGSPRSYYEVIVRSAATRAGCGTEGAEVRLVLDSQPPVIAYWHVRTMEQLSQKVDIVIGPPFALFDVELELSGAPRTVQAFVGDTLCAEAVAAGGGMIPFLQATLVVPPESLRPGCGKEGATVRFVVDGVAYSPTVPWTPGEQRIQLTPGPAFKPPETGSGGCLPR